MDPKAIDMNCEYLGVSRLQLMENAGKEIARQCIEHNKIVFFCGPGNNGGDGLAAARHLRGLGKEVRVYAVGASKTPEREKNLKALLNTDADISSINDSSDCTQIRDSLKGFDLIVDALIGVGLKGRLMEPFKRVVETINESKRPTISVDTPTGDETLKVNADVVLSLHNAKVPGAKVVDIGIPKEAELYCGPGDVYIAVPRRNPDAHKGDFGRLLVVGGSRDYVGTPTLVAEAALKTGVDLITVICPKYVADRMPFNPNLIVNSLESEDFLKEKDVDKILEHKFDTLAVGNGLSTSSDTKDAVRKLLNNVETPVVVDADALKLVKKNQLKQNMILTPHAGEFKTLFGEYENLDREKIVERQAKDTGATIVLKGKTDVISNGRLTKINKTGNPQMTVGGTGDTLAGLIAGLAAQNKMTFESACAGVFLNGLAGDLAYSRLGVSMAATDVVSSIPEAFAYCRRFE